MKYTSWKIVMFICSIVLILIGVVGRFNGAIDNDTFWHILIIANLWLLQTSETY